MSRSAVILLFVVIASAILALSLPPEATLLAWCAWGLLGISGAWLLFALVVGRRIRFDQAWTDFARSALPGATASLTAAGTRRRAPVPPLRATQRGGPAARRPAYARRESTRPAGDAASRCTPMPA